MSIDLYNFKCPRCGKGHLHPVKEMIRYVEFECMSCHAFTQMTPVVTDLLFQGKSMLPPKEKKEKITLKHLHDKLEKILSILGENEK